ncbi:heparinase II/III family protein [Maribacter sp. R77961]|uniref:heparinase II/III domain-containing protein n=1 Tax=Maribacter sp. R77961 TaxID=3093871 RepID=UPI0037C8D0ED
MTHRLVSIKKIVFVYLTVLLSTSSCAAQERSRPFIWVHTEERATILEKIEKKAWAAAYYGDLRKEVAIEVAEHQRDTDAYLRGMPLDWKNEVKGEIPPLTYTTTGEKGKHENLDNASEEEMAKFFKLSDYLRTAVDSGVLYYITGEEQYAQLSADILHTAVHGIVQLEPSTWKPRGGWLCPDDILREARVIGEKYPIAYDFIAAFLEKGGKPYDLGKQTKVSFAFEKAQQVFQTYADIVVHHGMINSNHPVLESNCLVYNALALEDETERNKYLNYYLNESTQGQDALAKVALYYKNQGDIWPESSQYTNDVAERTTKLMFLLTKYDPSLHLAQKYPHIPWALQRLDYLVYPNDELVLWGDGHRQYKTPYEGYELAYQLGKIDQVPALTERFSQLLGSAMASGEHKREGLEALLWYTDDFEPIEQAIVLPRTDEQPHAGIFLQRNLSPSQNPDDALMCFVGGAPMVHGHASGMNIELYGEGIVLGVDNGRGKYAKDIHENYSRLFAAHNTVIVNGASQGEGHWVNLGMDTVRLEIMEPLPNQPAVAPHYSFSTTTFFDGGGEKAEAEQKRTLALIRTSLNTGYYLDIFRSKSALPNEYHDYLYHNLGESLNFLNKDLILQSEPQRYMANAKGDWIRNRAFRNPGWHFFEEVMSSKPYTKDVALLFKAEGFSDKKRYMKAFLPGFEGRTYTKVKAPKTFEAPAPYDEMPTPTLVIRQEGEAYTKPFVAVYEPFADNEKNGSVLSVEKLTQNGLFQGVKVISSIAGESLTQYILTPYEGGSFSLPEKDIDFTGRFTILTFDGADKLKDVYLGNGERLQVGNQQIESMVDAPKTGYIDFSTPTPTISGKITLHTIK